MAMATGGAVGEDKGRRKKVELLQEAIDGLLQEKRGKPQQHQQQREGEDASSTMVLRDQEDDLFLSSLLSKLDGVEKDVDLDHDEPNSFHPKPESSNEVGLGDIAKDLNKIKRQNMITHILLGTVIVMTAVWQFNEVSFLLRVQEKLSNPFKYLGDMIKSSLKRDRKASIEASPLPPVGVPDVTRADLPMLVIGNDDG
ncbi:uncharacterized protein LOC100826468 [Brachypodium distachyon]|uniref:Uncharacterized protein n=1 Tax=Brachypodium distachyon TaxID=15368 RepID=I1I9X8_BRADI|nr:uncharacterized protein LOC100826468 [Brachypodium distachyon]KQJ99586.1 hypothetical protein BRADI_3g44100v3 [Brachypodium distachyon]|eukprot:XP_003575011.1 uncharacterized protein LOC100826468 [Brachypodium distachyon]